MLRQQYGFKGYVVSDSRAVEYLYSKHNVAADYKEAVRQVVEAGLNVRTDFTPPSDFILPLRELVKEGRLSMKTIDERVADVLRVKFMIGLFDTPFIPDTKRADNVVHTTDAAALSLQLNRESLVLLKNDKQLLPLDPAKMKNILVTGPLADATGFEVSRYGPSNNVLTSVLTGLKNLSSKSVNIQYAKGCELVDATWPESEIIHTPLTTSEQGAIDEAVAQANKSDVVIAVMGEDEKRVGESLSRTSLGLPGRQLALLEALHATGKPVVLVLMNGQPLTIIWKTAICLQFWKPGFLVQPVVQLLPKLYSVR